MIRDPILNLIHSVIIGLLLYIVFRFIFKNGERYSQISSIFIACLSCLYLLTYDLIFRK